MSETRKHRGRPRAYDPETALERASDVFWHSGYAGTSLDDLAAATGMNRPSLYAAFGDKRALYLKTLALYRDKARAQALSLRADDPPLAVFLTRFFDAALDVYVTGEGQPRGCYSIGTAGTEAAVNGEVRGFLEDSIRHTDRSLTALIEEARQKGEIDENADPSLLGSLATATLHSIAIRSRAGFPRLELKALADKAIALICRKA